MTSKPKQAKRVRNNMQNAHGKRGKICVATWRKAVLVLCSVMAVPFRGSHAIPNDLPRCKINPYEKSRNRVVNKYENVTLSCKNLSKIPFHKIIWQHKRGSGKLRALDRFSGLTTIVLSKVKRSDAGIYYCRVNDLAACSYQIHVNTKPRIESCSSTPIKLVINERSSISCRAKGWPKPATKWVFKRKTITKELEGVTLYENRLGYSGVIIERMSLQLEGTYVFIAENKFGIKTKELHVFSIPKRDLVTIPRVEAVSRYVTVARPGLNITVTCHATNATSLYFLPCWKFHPNCSNNANGYCDIIPPRRRWRGSELNFSLNLVNVSLADTGCYKCCLQKLQDDPLVEEKPTQNCETVHVSMMNSGKRRVKEQKDVEKTVLWFVSAPITGAVLLLLLICLFIKRKKHRSNAFIPLNDRTLKFDVFVSYNSQDYDWVEDKLLSLFDIHGVRYCIHSRDFEVGKPVVENMVDCVYTSQQVVAVISKNYMASSFCQEELHIAECKSKHENSCSLVAIRIDDINCKKLPKQLRKKTFLDYNDEQEKEVWEARLLSHLKLELFKQRESCTSSLTEGSINEEVLSWKHIV